MHAYVDLIGYVAAILTSVSFLPQALRVWRTDDTHAISLGMYSLFVAGVSLWLGYGLILGNHPIIAANLFTICVASTILYKKIKHLREGHG